MKGRDQSGSDASFADLQEMRERSKMLRDQVLGVQKSVQSKVSGRKQFLGWGSVWVSQYRWLT